MSILELAQRDVPDLAAVAEGEYGVEISSARAAQYKSGRMGYDVLLKIDAPNAQRVMHRVFLPMEGDDKEKEDNFIRNVKRFVEAFKIVSDEPEDWVGASTWAILGVETTEEYGDQNRVRRFVTGPTA